jgi:hypothetical protein
MSPTIQTVTALALVVGAALYFILAWLKKRKNPGCGGGCGCSASSKTKLGE